MIKGWRVFFYAVIAVAVLSIAYITVKFIRTERLLKATGDAEAAVRQTAARVILRRTERSPGRRRAQMEFLQQQQQTVRDNVVWAVEQMLADNRVPTDQGVAWIVQCACDLSGELPASDADDDALRLAVLRLGEQAVPALIEELRGTTQRTLERDVYAHRREVAARLLGQIGDRRATEPLIAALRDEYESVRMQAAAALARLDDPAAEEPLVAYLQPLLGVLRGEYYCYVRADSEGRVREDPDRDDLLYGPFVVRVKPHNEATEADLQRQRDSALDILKKEEARAALTRERLEEGRRGAISKHIKGATDLAIERVELRRIGLTVENPVGQAFDVIEGEPLEVEVDLLNNGPADLVADFRVAVYGAAPPPRNHVDRPQDGEFAGERARDNRALAGVFEEKHKRTMLHADNPATPEDDRLSSVTITVRFNTAEADRIQALQRLMDVAHESCIPSLGLALDDTSYTVRRQAARALGRVLTAAQTSPEGRQAVLALLRDKGLPSRDAVVRCLAAEGLELSEQADPATVEALQNLLLTDTDATVRQVATRSLTRVGLADREKLLPALVGRDPGVRRVAPRLFAASGDTEIVRQLLFGHEPDVAQETLRSASGLLTTADLVAALRLPDGRTRALAAKLLAERADPASREALLNALSDSEGDVRRAAAEGLGRLLRKEPDPAIVAALIGVIAAEAGDYVGVAAGTEPEDPATAVTTDKGTRAAAATALVGLDDQAARDALIQALADTSSQVIEAVLPAVASGSLGDQSPRLVALIKDTKLPARVRQAAELALMRTGDLIGATPPEPEAPAETPETAPETASEEAAPPEEEVDPREVVLDALVGLLNDQNNTVKTSAAVALIGLDDSRGDKVLRDQIRSKDATIRREAATLLATLPADRVARIRGLKDDDRDGLRILLDDLYLTGSLPNNYRFLCRSLIFLGDREGTVEAMRQALADPHPVLRAAGLEVLRELGEPVEEAAIKLLTDTNELPRAAAVRTAGQLRLIHTTGHLGQIAVRDPCEAVRELATDALRRLGRGG